MSSHNISRRHTAYTAKEVSVIPKAIVDLASAASSVEQLQSHRSLVNIRTGTNFNEQEPSINLHRRLQTET